MAQTDRKRIEIERPAPTIMIRPPAVWQKQRLDLSKQHYSRASNLVRKRIEIERIDLAIMIRPPTVWQKQRLDLPKRV